MAVTVLGGLMSSTLLNLLMLRALAQCYVRVTTGGARRLAA
jgi:Cu/Ag efflux pump CusA